MLENMSNITGEERECDDIPPYIFKAFQLLTDEMVRKDAKVVLSDLGVTQVKPFTTFLLLYMCWESKLIKVMQKNPTDL